MGFRYMKDGELCPGDKLNDRTPIQVESKSDLANLTDTFTGTIAYTAGFKNMWQLAADGTWEAIVEEG